MLLNRKKTIFAAVLKERGNEMFPFLIFNKNNLVNNSTLRQIVEGFFEAEGLEDCFWISERITGNKIEIFIDSDNGIDFTICRRVSRSVEAVLDETQEYGEKYTLEVSSPGVGSPLVMPRQYIKNVGRNIEVKANEERVKGKLESADDNGIVIVYEETIKEGKKKKKITKQKELAYSDIDDAKIKISFK